VLQKPALIELTISDANLNSSALEWRANVKTVQFWVRANDSADNSHSVLYVFTFDDTNPSVVLDGPANSTVLQKPALIELTISDANLNSSALEWRANVTQTSWTTTFTGSHDIDLSSFASDQTVQFWVRANDSADNSHSVSYVFTFDDTNPSIVLNGPVNETTLSKPSQINLTITDINLETVEWKANVTQTTWTNSFNGTFDINLTQFSTNQAVQFWVWANDTANNSNLINIILTFDDQPPTKPQSPSFSFQAGNVMLSWSASSDQSTICYQIWRNGECIGTTTSTSYLDTDSLPPGEYTYQIIPIDEANNIGEANTITVIISGQPPLLFDPITLLTQKETEDSKN